MSDIKSKYRRMELNLYDKSQRISYRFDTSRCTFIRIQDGILLGTVLEYGEHREKDATQKVIYSVALPIGKWELVDEDEYHRVTLKRIG